MHLVDQCFLSVPLKIIRKLSENVWFFHFLKKYWKRTLAWYGLHNSKRKGLRSDTYNLKHPGFRQNSEKKIDFHNANTLLKTQNVNSKIWCLIAYFSSIRNFNNCFSAVPSSCVCLVNHLFFFVYKILRKSCLAWRKRWINQNWPSEITNSYHCDDKRPCKS